jgi:hypothetical protein
MDNAPTPIASAVRFIARQNIINGSLAVLPSGWADDGDAASPTVILSTTFGLFRLVYRLRACRLTLLLY